MNSKKILWVFVVSCLVVLPLVLGCEFIGGQYLTQESFDLSVKGQKVHTSKPLDPSRVYIIKIYSRYNLSPLKEVHFKKLKTESEVFNPSILSKVKEFKNRKNYYDQKLKDLFTKRQKLLEVAAKEDYGPYKEPAFSELKSIEKELENLDLSRKYFEKEKLEFENKRQLFEKFKAQNPSWQLNLNEEPKEEDSFAPVPYPIDPGSVTAKYEVVKFQELRRTLFDYYNGSAVLFNSEPFVSYLLDPSQPPLLPSPPAYTPELYFELRGKGKPLSIQLAGDFSNQIGRVKTEIYLPSWWHKWAWSGGVVALMLLGWLGPMLEHQIKQIQEKRRLEQLRKREETKAKQEREQEETTQRLKRDDERREFRRQQEALERIEEEQRQRLEQEQEKEKLLVAQVKALRRRVEHEPNIFNEDYRKAYAKNKTAEVLKEHRQEWLNGHNALMYNEELASRIKEEAPEVLQWFRLRNEIIYEAERLAVTKHKPNPEEWRQKQLWWERIKAEDELAKLSVVGKSKELKFEFKNQKFKEIDLREDLEDYQKDELKQLWQDITGLEDKDNGQGKEPQVI